MKDDRTTLNIPHMSGQSNYALVHLDKSWMEGILICLRNLHFMTILFYCDYIGVSWNRGTRNSSILMVFSIFSIVINQAMGVPQLKMKPPSVQPIIFEGSPWFTLGKKLWFSWWLRRLDPPQMRSRQSRLTWGNCRGFTDQNGHFYKVGFR